MAVKLSFEVKLTAALEKLLGDELKFVDGKTADEVGETVTKEMKKRIAAGQSPIDGKGKFERYTNPKRYPGTKKPKSPVNLKLSGSFLDALTWEKKPGQYGEETLVFYRGAREEIKEKGHREGAGGQPERPTLPTEEGEKFHTTIKKSYVDLYRQRILDVLKGKG